MRRRTGCAYVASVAREEKSNKGTPLKNIPTLSRWHRRYVSFFHSVRCAARSCQQPDKAHYRQDDSVECEHQSPSLPVVKIRRVTITARASYTTPTKDSCELQGGTMEEPATENPDGQETAKHS